MKIMILEYFLLNFQKGKKKSYVNLGHHLEHEFLEYLRIYQIQNSQGEIILQKTIITI